VETNAGGCPGILTDDIQDWQPGAQYQLMRFSARPSQASSDLAAGKQSRDLMNTTLGVVGSK